MFLSSFQNVFSLPSRFETSLFFLFISMKRTRGTRRKTINLKTKIKTGEWYSEKRVSLYLSLLLISIQNFKSKAWIFLCDENLQKQSWVIFKKGGGHAATSVVGVWFHLFYDCNRSLASLEFQGINCPSTGWSKGNQGVGLAKTIVLPLFWIALVVQGHMEMLLWNTCPVKVAPLCHTCLTL